jgi:hypothetical protein
MLCLQRVDSESFMLDSSTNGCMVLLKINFLNFNPKNPSVFLLTTASIAFLTTKHLSCVVDKMDYFPRGKAAAI